MDSSPRSNLSIRTPPDYLIWAMRQKRPQHEIHNMRVLVRAGRRQDMRLDVAFARFRRCCKRVGLNPYAAMLNIIEHTCDVIDGPDCPARTQLQESMRRAWR